MIYVIVDEDTVLVQREKFLYEFAVFGEQKVKVVAEDAPVHLHTFIRANFLQIELEGLR